MEGETDGGAPTVDGDRVVDHERWRRLLLLATLAVSVLALLFVQLREGRLSAGRAIGTSLQRTEVGLEVSGVVPGSPAELGGLLAGDVILSVNHRQVSDITGYDREAEDLAPHREAVFGVRRADRTLELRITPGVPYRWGRWLLNAITVLCYLALGWLAMAQPTSDVRSRLLFFFTWAVAAELALPQYLVGNVPLQQLSQVLFYLVSGLQFGLELHLVSLLPAPRAWVRRRRWLIPAFYVFGGGLGVLSVLGYVAEEAGVDIAAPWSWLTSGVLLNDVLLPVWAVAVAGLLAYPAVTYPEPQGRHQAGLMLLGSLPWVALVLALTGTSLLGIRTPDWVDGLWSPVLLLFPLAVFIAIFRYHLLDLGFVVRRGLIYTTLTTALLLVFYAALGAGGVLLSGLFGSSSSVWVVASATLVLGLLFAPLRRFLQEQIDRRFFPERQALRQQLTALASELAAQGKLPAMVAYLMRRLGEIFNAESVTILVADPKTRVLVAVASSAPAFQDELDRSLLLSPDDPGLELLRRTRRPLPAEQLAERSGVLGYRLQSLGVALVAPLLFHQELIGALLVGHKRGDAPFAAEEVELLELFSHHVAVVIENARLFTSATYEALTGLFRREAILEQLQREVERARRYGRPFSVAMADLDHFKSINDRYGHLAGDTVLARVAQTLSSSIRFSDAIGRYGGEEFLLLFPETDLGGAVTVAEKIRRQVEGLRVVVPTGSPLGLTVSLGVATLDMDAANRDDAATALIGEADANLMRAKQAGRNRVEPAPSAPG
ncbi:MAG: diguanylate cyclase [Thermoanaerobaculaceae bacterium]